MLAILFVLGITIGPLIAAACALIAAEKGNYARAAVYHIVYMAGSMLWCLLPPLGLNLGILSAPALTAHPLNSGLSPPQQLQQSSLLSSTATGANTITFFFLVFLHFYPGATVRDIFAFHYE